MGGILVWKVGLYRHRYIVACTRVYHTVENNTDYPFMYFRGCACLALPPPPNPPLTLALLFALLRARILSLYGSEVCRSVSRVIRVLIQKQKRPTMPLGAEMLDVGAEGAVAGGVC